MFDEGANKPIRWLICRLHVCILTQDLDGILTNYKIAVFLCCRRDSKPRKWDRNSGCLRRWNKSGSRHQGRAELFSPWITVHFHIHIFTGTFIWALLPFFLPECILLLRPCKYRNRPTTPLEELKRHHAPAPEGWLWCPVRSMLIRKTVSRVGQSRGKLIFGGKPECI